MGGGGNEKDYAKLDDFVEEIRSSQEQAYSLARGQLKNNAERKQKIYDMRGRPGKFPVRT